MLKGEKKDIINSPYDSSIFYYKNNRSPLSIAIERNKDKILFNLLEEFSQLNLSPRIGIELEFYVQKPLRNEEEFLTILKQKLIDNHVDIQGVERENEVNQYEVQTTPYSDIIKLTKDVCIIKKIIAEFCNDLDNDAIFDAQPNFHKCGNAMQVNISLVDDSGKNLYSRLPNAYNELIDNDYMLHSVGGLCELMGESLALINTQDDYKRLDVELNKCLHEAGKYTAPTTITWGGNNRTAAIRLPSEKDYHNTEYMLDKNRRIEYRLPSASCDAVLAVTVVLAGVLNGISNEIIPPQKAFDNAYNIEKYIRLPNAFEAEKIFHNKFAKIHKYLMY